MRISRSVIVPVTSDEEWILRFANAIPLAPIRSPTIVVAPHPDDETLGAGALIHALRASGTPVTIVAVTDGENAYDTPLAERIELGWLREREQTNALQRLGVQATAVKRLRLHDSGLESQQQLLTSLLTELVEPGMTILAPWILDFHPDHVACARAAAAAASRKNARLVSYCFWTWHRGTPRLLEGAAVRRFDPNPEALTAKAEALSMHRSQLSRMNDEPVLPDRLLAPARWNFEIFLEE